MFVKETFIPNPDDLQRMQHLCNTLNKQVGPRTPLLPPPPPDIQLRAKPGKSETGTGFSSRNSSRSASPALSSSGGASVGCSQSLAAPGTAGFASSGSRTPSPVAGSNFLTVSVPEDAVKHIVGKQHKKIRWIRETSGASVEVGQKRLTGFSVPVIIRGTPEGIEAAKKLIEEVVDEQAAKSAQPRIARPDPVGLPFHNPGATFDL